MQDTSFRSQHTGASQHTKVQIPRLDRREHRQSSALAEKHRVIKACTNCRKRKVKCTGEFPRCKNCEGSDAPCIYELARKDRLKTATEQNQVLVSLLRDLSLRATEEDRKLIGSTLEAVDDDFTAPMAPGSTKASGKRPRRETWREASPDPVDDETQGTGEANAPGSVGSNEDLDLLDEDLFRSRESRETGFIGQNSEVQWLRSLQRQLGCIEETFNLPYGSPGTSNEATTGRINALHERRKINKTGSIQHVADSSFYLDSDNIEVAAMLDPYELPPPETSERLFSCYVETVHPLFPIVPEGFKDQFYTYIDAAKRQRRYQVPEKWQVTLNLIFAIGAQFSHLTEADWGGDSRDHLLYMTRAVRILGVKDTPMIISAPDLGLIQATGLLSFYYLIIGHVSRAWVMIGISLRFALAVGLHLRNEDPSAPAERKEAMVRIWWSLHSLECLLSAITGRPCIIDNADCTVPTIQVLPEERAKRSSKLRGSANEYINPVVPPSTHSGASDSFTRVEGRAITDPFLGDHIKIGLTTRKVLKTLYSARTASSSWERIQTLIPSLIAELDRWAAAALPSGLGPPDPNLDFTTQRDQVLLSFHYYSIKILITRPCLCRLERRIQSQSNGSADFNQRMAEACVQAAQDMTLLLPEQPDPVYIYQRGPWWSIIHNIMQAMAVLLLETFYQGTHMSIRGNEEIPKCVKKLLRWLRSMRLNNALAERAYKLVVSILKNGEARGQTDITDLLAEDEAENNRQNFAYAHYPGASFPSDFGNVFASGEWQPDLYDAGHLPPMPDSYFLPELFQMPHTYGNPFLTNFDEQNPISFTMDGLVRSAGEHSTEFSPDHHPLQQHQI